MLQNITATIVMIKRTIATSIAYQSSLLIFSTLPDLFLFFQFYRQDNLGKAG
jgi:hypothetical protein